MFQSVAEITVCQMITSFPITFTTVNDLKKFKLRHLVTDS